MSDRYHKSGHACFMLTELYIEALLVGAGGFGVGSLGCGADIKKAATRAALSID